MFLTCVFPRKVCRGEVSGGHVRHASAAGATGYPYHAHQHALGEAYRQDRRLAETWKAGDWLVETWGTGWWLQSYYFFLIFHVIYGMSSQPHWRTPSFFKMGTLHHQPGKNNGNKKSQVFRYRYRYRYDWWRKLQDFLNGCCPGGHKFQISVDLCTVPFNPVPIPILILYLSIIYLYIYMNGVVLFCFCYLGCSIYIQYTYIYICVIICV